MSFNAEQFLLEHKIKLIDKRIDVAAKIRTDNGIVRAARQLKNADPAIEWYLNHREEYSRVSLTTIIFKLIKERPSSYGKLTWNEINFCIRFPNIVLRPDYDYSIKPPAVGDFVHFIKSMIPNTPENVMRAMKKIGDK